MDIWVLLIQIVVSAINSCNIHKAVDCDHDRNTECLEASHFTLILYEWKMFTNIEHEVKNIFFYHLKPILITSITAYTTII